MTRMRHACRLLAFLAVLSVPRAAAAVIFELPPSLAPLVLSETAPFAFDPADFSAEDFTVAWMGPAPSGVTAALKPQSIEWVRVKGILVMPRALLTIAGAPADGSALHNGAVHPLKAGAVNEFPVALVSGEQNEVVLRWGKDEFRLALRFDPKKKVAPIVDTTCSPRSVEAVGELPAGSWMNVGCRLVYEKSTAGFVPSLELFVFWDNVGRSIAIDGVATSPASVSLWVFRLSAGRPEARLEARGRTVTLKASLPPRLHLGSLGLGIGPYGFRYTAVGDPARATDSLAAVATLYGSVFFSETMRFVMFTVAPLHANFFADVGLYLWVEQFRGLDDRLSFNLLLGGHLLAFPYLGGFPLRVGFPQGLEAIFRDLPGRGHSLSAGAFVFPKITGTSYYNLWLRWSLHGYFVEANYIQWEDTAAGNAVRGSVAGVSVGVPLLKFL